MTGRRKLHFTLTDGRELAEEYDTRTNELVGKSNLHVYQRIVQKSINILL